MDATDTSFEMGEDGKSILIRIPFDHNFLITGAPSRPTFDKRNKVWIFPLNPPNIEYIKREWHGLKPYMTEAVIAAIRGYEHATGDTAFPKWYRFGEAKPMPQQMEVMNLAWMKPAYAIFHEMGLGKTFDAIHLACAYHQMDRISKVVVICPTSVKSVWENEFVKYATSKYVIYSLEAGKEIKFERQRGDMNSLRVLVVGIEAFSGGKGYDKVATWIGSLTKCLAILDESSRIKNFKAGRTKKAIEIGKLCVARLILTGTPITQGLQDLYSQFEFLDKTILGYNTYYTFRNRYCQLEQFVTPKGDVADKIVGYKNINELLTMVKNYSHRMRTVDAIELPDRTFEARNIEPTAEQKTAYKELKQDMKAEYLGETLTVRNMLERLTRYQQLAGGFMPYRTGTDKKGKPTYDVIAFKKNPKVIELHDILDDVADDRKVIIWCRFRPEIEAVATSLCERYGYHTVVEFHGGVDGQARKEAVADFEDENSPVRFFVSNQTTGGLGITLIAASLVVYFSNTFSYEDRVQSEARAYRKGQTKQVQYVDLYLKLPVDKLLQRAIALKTGLAEYVSDTLQDKHAMAELDL